MAGIGIIANPASGKDIRRLVSYATTIDNQEKVNIVKRIVLAAQGLGIDDIWIMPDTFNIGYNALDDLEISGRLKSNIHIMDMDISGTVKDTIFAASEMEKMGLGCIVVLGGDGTSRAVAKGISTVPLLPVSTGTNNVYPLMTEGTVAGMAAAAAALIKDKNRFCIRDKRLEIFLNGEFRDIALIDAVISDDIWIGSKAIWDPKKIRQLFVTRAHPASIGFSSVAGCARIVNDIDAYGLAMEFGEGKIKMIAPIAAGVMTQVSIKGLFEIPIGSEKKVTAENSCMVALDGEREIKAKKGDELAFRITRNGPLRVKIKEAVERAMKEGLFERD